MPPPRAPGILVVVALAVLAGSASALRLGAGVAPHGGMATDTVVRAVRVVGMTVSDMDRAVDFYTTVLTFRKLSDREVLGEQWERLTGVFGARMRIVRLALGDERLELTEYLAPTGRPVPVDSHSDDQWFQHVALIVSDMDSAYARLRHFKVRHASTGPQRLPDWNPAAGGIEAFYFKDPDGHALEILEFPEGKGDPKWRARDGRLFLGIDHTAIVVRDTERSLRFYRDVLGMRVAGESRNYGTEQEHLNNVEGASLRITGLRAAAGPGIELLEYLEPRTGRPTPDDVHSNDLIHWEITVEAPDLDESMSRVAGASVPVASRGPADLPPDALGFGRAVLLRDPDRHVLRLTDAERGR